MPRHCDRECGNSTIRKSVRYRFRFEIILGEPHPVRRGRQPGGMLLDQLQPVAQTFAIGDLNVQSRPRIEFQQQRAAVSVDDYVCADIAKVCRVGGSG